jgi:hypothetical protein
MLNMIIPLISMMVCATGALLTPRIVPKRYQGRVLDAFLAGFVAATITLAKVVEAR